MHTIIGAASFHGPVRDGKGWVQSAIAAKRNCNLEEVNLTGLNGGNLLCQNDKYYFKVYQKRTHDNNKESGESNPDLASDSNDDADNVD